MLLFVDESGHDRREAPYEVLAGIAVRERDLWNLLQAIRLTEREVFGVRLAEVGIEFKGKKLLKSKVFRHAFQSELIQYEQRRILCGEFLHKGQREALGGPTEPRRREEFVAYGQAVLDFVDRVFDLCAQFRVTVFASMVATEAPRPSANFLRKDYSYLFERFYYYLEDVSTDEMGLVVFDELEKAQCRILIDQMAHYFADTTRGRARAARIVPEPFFVHSDLTTAVQLADIVAYSLNWGVRLNRMTKPTRPEIEPFARRAFDLRYIGQRPSPEDGRIWPVYGLTYIEDLRPRAERDEEGK
jgi:hypothetical protein